MTGHLFSSLSDWFRQSKSVQAVDYPYQRSAQANKSGNDNVKAFTLVELSIVLVILGLLVGGVLAGQNLIASAQLRSTLSQFADIQAATMQFKEKYFYLPGDIPNATDFGMQAPDSRPGVTPGNGRIESSNGSIEYSRRVGGLEQSHFFYHLREKDFMTGGGYTPGTNRIDPATAEAIQQQFLPTTIDPTAVWMPYWDDADQQGEWNKNAIALFRHGDPGGGGVYNASPAFTPQQAWHIDTKLDDGSPEFGKIHSGRTDTNFISYRGNGSASCVQGGAGSREYLLSNSDIACGLIFQAGF